MARGGGRDTTEPLTRAVRHYFVALLIMGFVLAGSIAISGRAT